MIRKYDMNVVSGNTLDVHFRNSGFGTDEGVHRVQLFELKLDRNDGSPLAIVCSPFGLQNTKLEAYFETWPLGRWICDLD